MASMLPVLLLSLFLQCTPSYSQSLCVLENAQSGTYFNFSVSPSQYKPNTTYTVTISGLPNNVSVALSASRNNSAIGTWENNARNCSGISTVASVSLVEQWISSSESYSNVEIRAYVTVDNVTNLQTETLQSPSSTTIVTYRTSTPMTTRAPSSTTIVTYRTSTPMTTRAPSSTTIVTYRTSTPMTTRAPSSTTIVTYRTSTPMTTHASSNITIAKNESTTPKTTHDNNNTTSSMMNNMTTQISTSAAKKSTPQNAAGMVISFKPLYAFTCMLLFLVTAPELLPQRV